MSREVFARTIHVNTRTLEGWEQGRGVTNDTAVALLLLVRRYPDTIERLQNLVAARSAGGYADNASSGKSRGK
jgi:putative transcriptional regulator